MESDPLDRRTSSRRQRRADREAATAAAENDEKDAAIVEQQQTVSFPSTTAAAAVPRGPSDDIERRIAESIAKRTKSNAAAAVNEEYHDKHDNNNNDDVENEILGNYEYLDHTADIQIHSWGESFAEALELLAQAMFGYQTRKLSLVDINDEESAAFGSHVRVEGHDRESLVYNFLQEWLCRFHESGFIPREVTVQSVDLENYTAVSSGKGERMRPEKHLQGTEVKAITYSNLQVIQDENNGNRIDIWVILDI